MKDQTRLTGLAVGNNAGFDVERRAPSRRGLRVVILA